MRLSKITCILALLPLEHDVKTRSPVGWSEAVEFAETITENVAAPNPDCNVLIAKNVFFL